MVFTPIIRVFIWITIYLPTVEGWKAVGLVGRPVADSLRTTWSPVNHSHTYRSATVCQPKSDILTTEQRHQLVVTMVTCAVDVVHFAEHVSTRRLAVVFHPVHYSVHTTKSGYMAHSVILVSFAVEYCSAA